MWVWKGGGQTKSVRGTGTLHQRSQTTLGGGEHPGGEGYRNPFSHSTPNTFRTPLSENLVSGGGEGGGLGCMVCLSTRNSHQGGGWESQRSKKPPKGLAARAVKRNTNKGGGGKPQDPLGGGVTSSTESNKVFHKAGGHTPLV